jgi:arginase family enzyme
VTRALNSSVRARPANGMVRPLAESGLLCCVEIVEVNPSLDRQSATAALAVELAARAFGATTL